MSVESHGRGKERLDLLLVRRQLAETRERARALILAGEVSVEGQVVSKVGTLVSTDAHLTVRRPPLYVSRGGLKLAAALQAFEINPAGKVCADIGASTGGFTDVLVQGGAARVYAIDVGYGQLAWRLRQDPRVVVMDRVNLRYLEALPEPVQLVTVDVSFISLEIILRRVSGATGLTRLLANEAQLVALIKPQFEAGRTLVGRGGIVRDPRVHRLVLERIISVSISLGFGFRGLIASPILGGSRNREFLMHLTTVDGQESTARLDPASAIARVTDGGLAGQDSAVGYSP